MNVAIPNFLIVGAMRAGTTSAFRYLGQHPEIFFPGQKEPNFLAFMDAPPAHAGPGDASRASGFVTERASYHALFEPGAGHRVRGEASTTYLYLPEAMNGISRVCPDAVCLVMLRHPVDRAYSAYQYLRSQGRENIDSFVSAIEAEPDRVSRGFAPIWHYLRASFYAPQLARLQDTVGRDNVVVCLFDDLADHGPQALRPVLDRLGLDPLPTELAHTVHNPSGRPRRPGLDALLKSSHAKRRVKQALPEPVQVLAERAWRSLDSWRSNNVEPPTPLSPDLREELSARFDEDLERTEALAGVDLTAWRSRSPQ